MVILFEFLGALLFMGIFVYGVFSFRKLAAAARANAKLRAAAKKLYFAGEWKLDDANPVYQEMLWEDLRDALGLPAGSATKAGVGSR